MCVWPRSSFSSISLRSIPRRSSSSSSCFRTCSRAASSNGPRSRLMSRTVLALRSPGSTFASLCSTSPGSSPAAARLAFVSSSKCTPSGPIVPDGSLNVFVTLTPLRVAENNRFDPLRTPRRRSAVQASTAAAAATSRSRSEGSAATTEDGVSAGASTRATLVLVVLDEQVADPVRDRLAGVDRVLERLVDVLPAHDDQWVDPVVPEQARDGVALDAVGLVLDPLDLCDLRSRPVLTLELAQELLELLGRRD